MEYKQKSAVSRHFVLFTADPSCGGCLLFEWQGQTLAPFGHGQVNACHDGLAK